MQIFDNPITRQLCQCCREVVILDAGDRDLYCARCIRLATDTSCRDWPEGLADRLEAVRAAEYEPEGDSLDASGDDDSPLDQDGVESTYNYEWGENR